MRISKYFLLLPFLIALGCATSQEKSKEAQIEQNEKERIQIRDEVKEEVAVGKGIASKLLGHYGASKSKRALEYVNLVGSTLAEQSGRPEITFRFAILKSREMNAFAAPGGYIFVTTGLLKNIRNESELAAVLAHEIAHVNERHMYKQIQPKKKEVTAGETITRLLSRGGSDLGATITKMVKQGVQVLLEKGIEHELEFEADMAAVMYVSAAGYNPTSLKDLLRRISKKKKKRSVFSKTHPSFADRSTRLRGFLSENGLEDSMQANKKVLKKRFRKYLARKSKKRKKKI